MILPIYIFGHSILRKKATSIPKEYPNLPQLINDMFDTMHNSLGIGLAAPQIGKSIRLFIVDASSLEKDDPNCANFSEVFINPKIISYFNENVAFEEGCLSIPQLRDKITRKSHVSISYYDKNWQWKENVIYDGWIARIIQHEYDHLNGILFTDKLPPLRRQLIKSKLQNIAKGKFDQTYKVVLAT